MNRLLLFITALAALTARASGPVPAVVPANFARYQPILDRKPFGEVAPLPVAGAAEEAVPAVSDVVKDYEMKGIIGEGARLKVAFLNKTTSKYVYLSEGEELDGVRLLSVDYDNEEARLQMGAQTMILKLRPNKEAGAETPPPQVAAADSLPSPGAPVGWTQVGGDGEAPRLPFGGRGRRRTAFQRLGTNAPGGARSLEFFFKPNTNVATPFFSPFRPQPDSSPLPAPAAPSPDPGLVPAAGLPTNPASPFQPFISPFQPVPVQPVPEPLEGFEDDGGLYEE
ncbi:MAG: hypothetical protein GX608_13400 [Lentisphaerae bacterium]|nr:hypothetical protein [Lentisphaerota bacterium]